jgi:DNA-binding XRE family transcriptional regulator
MSDKTHEEVMQEFRERRLRIVEMRDEKKMTFAQIGKELGVSRQAAQRMYATERRKM